MWNTVLGINSALWALAAIFFVYSVGASIFWWTPKPFEIAFVIGLILTGTEVLFGCFSE